MQTYALLALAAAGYASAQGVAAGTLLPSSSPPSGCSLSYASSFEITIVQAAASTKRDIQKRQSTTCASTGVLVATLTNGVLTDSAGRIGGIVANRQFQFDGPPSQTGTIYNGGFSVCNNGSLALGGSNIFYQCLSGSFYNLYDQAVAPQCQQVLIDVIPCTASSAASTPAASTTASVRTSASVSVVAQSSDGQVTGASATTTTTRAPVTTVASQITDGQVQASSAGPRPVSQYTDGQIQVTGSAPAAPVVTSSATRAPVSQISDGQIQATSAATKSVVTSAASNGTATATRAVYTGAANLASYGAEVVVGAAAAAAFALF